MFYNLVTNLVIDKPQHYHPYTSIYNTHYDYHPIYYIVPWSSTTYYQISFFPRPFMIETIYPIKSLSLIQLIHFLNYYVIFDSHFNILMFDVRI